MSFYKSGGICQKTTLDSYLMRGENRSTDIGGPMRISLLLLAGLFFLASCGPRQDEIDRDNGGFGGGGGATQLAAGGEEVTAQDGQLPSSNCGPRDGKADDKGLRWSTIFLHNDLNGIFDKAEDITIFVGRGRNCNFVSNTRGVQFGFGLTPETSPPEAEKSSFSRYITKIVGLNTAEFLANDKLVQEAAAGMLMSVADLKAYIGKAKGRAVGTISLTYLSKAPGKGVGSGKPDVKPGFTDLAVGEDAQLESSGCGPRKPGEKGLKWTNLLVRHELKDHFDKAKDISIYVVKGRNCNFVSSKTSVPFGFQDEEDTHPKDARPSDFTRFITKIEAMSTSDLLADKSKVDELASAMAMTTDRFNEYLNNKPQDKVALVYLSEGPGSPGGGSKPVVGKVEVPYGTYAYTKLDGSQPASCTSDEVWQLVPLNFSLSFMFPKISELTRYIQVGPKNCFEVNANKTVQVTAQEEVDGKYIDQGFFFKVTEVLQVHVDTLFEDKALMDEVAKGMFIPKAEIKAMIRESGEKNVTITSLEPSAEIKPVAPGPSTITLSMPAAEGERLPVCTEPKDGKPKDITFKDIRVFSNQEAQFKSKIENKTLKVWIGQGDFNCLVIGADSGFVLSVGKDAAGKTIWSPIADHPVKIQSITVMPKKTIQEVPFVKEKLAFDAGFSNADGTADLDNFTKYIESLKGDMVNITTYEWL